MQPMRGRSILLAGWASLWLIPAAHAGQVPLTVGDTTIQFPADADYVAISQADPRLFSASQAVKATRSRLPTAPCASSPGPPPVRRRAGGQSESGITGAT